MPAAADNERLMSKCEAYRKEALEKNPAVRFMFAHLKRAGCRVTSENVECKQCDGQMAGGFQDDGKVILCANHIGSQEHASTTIVHEAVHAFDECRANVDWTNCVHHACSEIRAATLSGDCSFVREVVLRRNFGWGKQFQRCIRRRAELSVGMNPHCDKLAAKEAVQTAWNACYSDTTPFDQIP